MTISLGHLSKCQKVQGIKLQDLSSMRRQEALGWICGAHMGIRALKIASASSHGLLSSEVLWSGCRPWSCKVSSENFCISKAKPELNLCLVLKCRLRSPAYPRCGFECYCLISANNIITQWYNCIAWKHSKLSPKFAILLHVKDPICERKRFWMNSVFLVTFLCMTPQNANWTDGNISEGVWNVFCDCC